MSIGIGSKWVKDGEIVEVKDTRFNECFIYGETCVWFITPTNPDNLHVLTLSDFLEQYKHYEPVYEYRFMYQLNDINFGEWHLHPAFYQTVEDCINYTTRNAYNFQRLDFTKRERKQ